MGLPKVNSGFDAAAYLAWEEAQPERNEYIAGEVFAMVGVRQSHNVATLNLATILRRELKGSPCRVFVESVKTRVEAADCFFYPDVAVTCDARDRQPEASLAKQHPALIIEVLSDSTAAFDRGDKFAAYRRFTGLKTVLCQVPMVSSMALARVLTSWLCTVSGRMSRPTELYRRPQAACALEYAA